MFSLEKARRTLERWLTPEEDSHAPSCSKVAENRPSAPPSGDREARTRHFMDELRDGSQEWLGRVRLVSLDTIREKVGPRWPKLQDKIEILTAKVIQAELMAHDRYLNMGEGEFLVFFADASPEESRIRCLGIVESIRRKLFGDDPNPEFLSPVAECDLIHRDDARLTRLGRPRTKAEAAPHRTDFLRRPIGQEARKPDARDVLLSSQTALDSILSRALQSRELDELNALLLRLEYLCRGLRTLEPMLEAVACEQARLKAPPSPGPTAPMLGRAWEDIVELISALDPCPERPLADRLKALTQLRQTRAERAEAADEEANPANHRLWRTGGKFEYLPVYRSTAKGERIVQGIYRVEPPVRGWKDYLANRDSPVDALWRDQAVRVEKAILEHAIAYLLEHESAPRFMLMVPVHVDTLQGPHSLMQYSTILRSAQLRVRKNLLIEIVGYRDSDDTIGLRRAIDELRAHTHAVFLTLDHKAGSIEKAAAQCKSLGAHALGVDMAPYGDRKPAILGALNSLVCASRQHSIAAYVGGIANIGVLATAIAGDAHYFASPALRPALASPNEMEVVTLKDLYTAV